MKTIDNRPRTAAKDKKGRRIRQSKMRFPERRHSSWEGPLVDYKEVDLLQKYMSSGNKLMSRRRAGTSASEQRALSIAIKRARFMALIPY